tara:strand:- start:862 stop:1149 length:288 start_codon:yes stop_codon:yes gene_type:complete
VFTRQFSFLGSAVFQKDNRSGKELSYNEEVQREMEKLRREYQIKREKFLDLYGSVPPNMTEEQQVYDISYSLRLAITLIIISVKNLVRLYHRSGL